jgi:hypothetical protein
MKRIDEQLDTMDREESLHPMVRQTYEGRCPSAGLMFEFRRTIETGKGQVWISKIRRQPYGASRRHR